MKSTSDVQRCTIGLTGKHRVPASAEMLVATTRTVNKSTKRRTVIFSIPPDRVKITALLVYALFDKNLTLSIGPKIRLGAFTEVCVADVTTNFSVAYELEIIFETALIS